MHIIMFARVALEAVRLVERLNLAFGFLRSLAVHIPLLLQMADLPSAPRELDQTLLADKQKHHRKKEDSNDVLTPFANLDCVPKV